jgi:hypothetical protein
MVAVMVENVVLVRLKLTSARYVAGNLNEN